MAHNRPGAMPRAPRIRLGRDDAPGTPEARAPRRGGRAYGAAVACAILALISTATCAHAGVKAPNDPLFPYQWNLRTMQIPAAWAASRGAGAVVAVLDTGVAYEDRGPYRRAPDFAGTRFVPGWDFVDGDAHPDDVPPRDRRSHGTEIAAIIAQTANNGIGGAGVAPGAAIMPVRVLRPDLSGSARTIARGLRFAADHGANVANLSIAGPQGSPILRAAIDYAYAKGVTIVASAGNDGRPTVGYPAAYPKVIAVGAVYQDMTRASYSSYGTRLALVAPAGGRTLDANGFGSGDGVVAQTLKGGPATFCLCFSASTSAAAAEVSGVAALVVAAGRSTTPAAVRAALVSSARDLGAPGPDPEYGAGLVQAATALGVPAERSGARRGGRGAWALWLAASLAVAAALTGLALAARSRWRRGVR